TAPYRQVWNRQRKQEVLLDVENVADGYETKFKWNERDKWIFSDQVAHESLVSVEDFERAQQIRAAAGRGRDTRERIKVERTYVLRGLVRCGLRGREMQAQHNNDRAFYRCRYAQEYALANHVTHPLNVYLKEKDVLPALDGWLGKLFAPHRIEETVRAMVSSQDASPITGTDAVSADAARKLAECDTKLKKYRAALEAGTDPETVGEWIAEVKAERAAINTEAKTQLTGGQSAERLDETEINAMIKALGDIRPLIQAAEPADKAKVYKELGLELTYEPGKQIVRAQVILGPDIRGVIGSVRGGT
ncbi:MAG TPA: recombinase family protein, partial [Actinospica sp.]|nr:recombinase family protein [Actinospica sp.]